MSYEGYHKEHKTDDLNGGEELSAPQVFCRSSKLPRINLYKMRTSFYNNNTVLHCNNSFSTVKERYMCPEKSRGSQNKAIRDKILTKTQ